MKKWIAPHEQSYRIGKNEWRVPVLFELARNLPVMEIPLAHLNTWYEYESMSLSELAGHMLAVLEADMDCPIILDENGVVMDGRHRILRAMVYKKETIKAVRFEVNPQPCKVYR